MYMKIIKLLLVFVLLGCGEKRLVNETAPDIIMYDSYNSKQVESIAKYDQSGEPEFIKIMFTDKTSIVLEAGKYEIILK